jgi:hypothetical protein
MTAPDSLPFAALLKENLASAMSWIPQGIAIGWWLVAGRWSLVVNV